MNTMINGMETETETQYNFFWNFVMTTDTLNCFDVEIFFMSNPVVTKINISGYLEIAMGICNLELAELCLKFGADMYFENGIIMLNSIQIGNYTNVEFLIKKGYDISINGSDAICRALTVGNYNISELLIKSGADIFAFDCTPIMYIITSGDIDLFVVALQHNLSKFEQNFMQLLVCICSSDDLEMLKIYENVVSETHLHFGDNYILNSAIRSGAKTVTNYLLQSGFCLSDSLDIQTRMDLKLMMINLQ